jgi:outer membrane protein OmpA-like peptidoglycan-associated protein
VNRGPLLLLAAALSASCSHLQHTDQLDAARTAYDQAQKGPAAAASPADLATAKKFLDLAEKGLETGDPKLVDDRAAVAILKIQAAEALGRTHTLAAERDKTLQAVSVTKQQLLEDAQQKLAQTQAELEKEKASRDAVEARLVESRDVLAREALIRDLPEGTVITLPGGQLFAKGGADLLPGGRVRLSRVADFLKSASRSARVEALPAKRGSRSAALALSGKRAERVRDFLVGQGITPEQIRAERGRKTPAHPLPPSLEFVTNGAVNIILEPARSASGSSGSGRN